jgi:hypothetical protein
LIQLGHWPRQNTENRASIDRPELNATKHTHKLIHQEELETELTYKKSLPKLEGPEDLNLPIGFDGAPKGKGSLNL